MVNTADLQQGVAVTIEGLTAKFQFTNSSAALGNHETYPVDSAPTPQCWGAKLRRL